MERGADRNSEPGRLTGSGLAIGGVELAQIARNALLDLRHAPFHLSLREVVVARVHPFDGGAIVLAEIGNHLVIGNEPSE